ncbi:hypothetical protein BLOT_007864 [Blomia tropicalis]|nr:hypothetical protein BLOT_007864 [Blomia tropicalis]
MHADPSRHRISLGRHLVIWQSISSDPSGQSHIPSQYKRLGIHLVNSTIGIVSFKFGNVPFVQFPFGALEAAIKSVVSSFSTIVFGSMITTVELAGDDASMAKSFECCNVGTIFVVDSVAIVDEFMNDDDDDGLSIKSFMVNDDVVVEAIVDTVVVGIRVVVSTSTFESVLTGVIVVKFVSEIIFSETNSDSVVVLISGKGDIVSLIIVVVVVDDNDDDSIVVVETSVLLELRINEVIVLVEVVEYGSDSFEIIFVINEDVLFTLNN